MICSESRFTSPIAAENMLFGIMHAGACRRIGDNATGFLMD